MKEHYIDTFGERSSVDVNRNLIKLFTRKCEKEKKVIINLVKINKK